MTRHMGPGRELGTLRSRVAPLYRSAQDHSAIAHAPPPPPFDNFIVFREAALPPKGASRQNCHLNFSSGKNDLNNVVWKVVLFRGLKG